MYNIYIRVMKYIYTYHLFQYYMLMDFSFGTKTFCANFYGRFFTDLLLFL